MKYLLARGSKADAADSSGWTALHSACSARNVVNADAIRLLLQAGANPNAKSQYESTPFHWACETSGTGVGLMALLLQYKADANQGGYGKKTPLLYVLESKGEDKLARVKLLVQHGADIHWKTACGRTPLDAAISSGCAEAAKLFLQLGAKLDLAPNLLYNVCDRGHHEVAEVLLDRGALVNAVGGQRRETPLFRAISGSGKKEEALRTIDLLADRGADVNWKSHAGNTPLHHACNIVKPGKPERVRLLLTKAADANAVNDKGEAPLHVVCRERFSAKQDQEAAEASRALLEYGADVEAVREKDSATPFIHASMVGCDETKQQLFEFVVDGMPSYEDDE